MENIKNEKEEVKTERQPNANRGLIALAAVGIGCGMYGYFKGRGVGYDMGLRDATVFVSGQFINATKRIAELSIESKGD